MTPLTPEQLTSSSRQFIPILEAMDISFLEAADGHAVVELPGAPNVNHFGALYAGSLFTAAEVLGGVISRSTFDLEGELAGFVPLLRSFEIQFLRPAMGTVLARATMAPEDIARLPAEALAQGKANFTLEAEIVDGSGTTVARTRGEYQLRRF